MSRLGVKRTWPIAVHMSAYDPKRTCRMCYHLDLPASAGDWEDTMKTQYAVALAVAAGFGLGAIAVQGLHAQATPKAYIVSESEVLDAAVIASTRPLAASTAQAGGGRRLALPGAKIVAFVGEPPKRVGITEFESLEKAQAYRNSAAFKELQAQLDKARKTVRAYAVEGAAN